MSNVMDVEEVMFALGVDGILDVVELGSIPEDVIIEDDAVFGVMLRMLLADTRRVLTYALDKGYRQDLGWRVAKAGEGPHRSVTKESCPHFFLVLHEQDGKLVARYLNETNPDDEELGRLSKIVNTDLHPGFSNEVSTFNEVLLALGEKCADPGIGQ
jgi:hypothetical protein